MVCKIYFVLISPIFRKRCGGEKDGENRKMQRFVSIACYFLLFARYFFLEIALVVIQLGVIPPGRFWRKGEEG